MQVDYLFLIPLMPSEKLDVQRLMLRDLCFSQLRKLKCSYRVWLLGDMEKEIADFEIIKVKGVSKEDKLWEAGKILEAGYEPPSKYLVRLDDDDLINPEVFDAFAKEDADCFTDHYHTFYDLSSGNVSSQKRPWFPNTVIHRFKHAIQKVPAQGGSVPAGEKNFLFACDHSQVWHSYYADKNVKYTSKEQPLYVRVLNPGSITAQKANYDAYSSYLSGFGLWKSSFPIKGSELQKDLKEIWLRENESFKKYEFPKSSMLKRVVKRIIKQNDGYENAMVEWVKFSYQSSDVVMATNACGEEENVSNAVSLHKTKERVFTMFSGFECGNKLSKPVDFNFNTPGRYYNIVDNFHQVNHHLILEKIDD